MDEPVQLLLSTARTVLDLIKRLVQLATFPPSPPNHVVDTFLISTFTILRIAKIYPKNVWVADAESCINSCKLLARSLSSNENDSLFKTATMLDDLWRNPRAYRRPDGSADAPIAYLGRLSAGLVIDAVSKWHDIADTFSAVGLSGPGQGPSMGQPSEAQCEFSPFFQSLVGSDTCMTSDFADPSYSFKHRFSRHVCELDSAVHDWKYCADVQWG
jgi:hypothetical protein